MAISTAFSLVIVYGSGQPTIGLPLSARCDPNRLHDDRICRAALFLPHLNKVRTMRNKRRSRSLDSSVQCALMSNLKTMVKLNEQFQSIIDLAARLAEVVSADALMILLEGPTDWQELREATTGQRVVLAADYPLELEGAAAAGFPLVVLNMPESPVHEKLTQALLESVADDILTAGARVVAIYSGFEADTIDSISVIHLDEHLGRLTSHDLRQLESKVPLDTLKTVVELAVEIGREGREGKPVGTLFVVGDTRKVLASSHALVFDPVRGYSRKERNLFDPKVREGIKEIAQMDGAFVVALDGTVEAASRYLDASAESITLSKGLGARHWAAAAITKRTKSVGVVVSESNGTVRIFSDGEVFLRIEPFRRAMKWKDFEYEPPALD
jgi:diadenylate cyclase